MQPAVDAIQAYVNNGGRVMVLLIRRSGRQGRTQDNAALENCSTLGRDR